MRLLISLAALAGVMGALAVLLPTDQPGWDVAPAGRESAVQEPAPEMDGAPAAASQIRPRAIAPGVVAPPPVDPAALQRLEPRAPLSELALALPPKPKDPGPLLFQPIAEAAGLVRSGDRMIAIAGVTPLAVEERCTDSAGREWPCGKAARTAFRALLRGRAVECPGITPETQTLRCAVGGRDIGAWLVANGWARPAAADAYLAESARAKAEGRGLYGLSPAPLQAAAPSPPG